MSDTIFVITGFDDGYHSEVAYIEAEDEHEARRILDAALDDDLDLGYIVAKQETDVWVVREAQRPLRFILGGGCR